MEFLMESKIDNLIERPGTLGICVSDESGLSLSTRGSLKSDVGRLGSQLLALCSRLEPSSATLGVALLSDSSKITFSKHEGTILAVHQKATFRITMAEVNLVIEFSGGCEFLVGNRKEHKVAIQCDKDFLTVADVINYARDVMLKDCDRQDLLIQGETIRPGVLVLVNECDWKLLDCEKCQLHNGDVVTFISTLHGG